VSIVDTFNTSSNPLSLNKISFGFPSRRSATFWFRFFFLQNPSPNVPNVPNGKREPTSTFHTFRGIDGRVVWFRSQIRGFAKLLASQDSKDPCTLALYFYMDTFTNVLLFYFQSTSQISKPTHICECTIVLTTGSIYKHKKYSTIGSEKQNETQHNVHVSIHFSNYSVLNSQASAHLLRRSIHCYNNESFSLITLV